MILGMTSGAVTDDLAAVLIGGVALRILLETRSEDDRVLKSLIGQHHTRSQSQINSTRKLQLTRHCRHYSMNTPAMMQPRPVSISAAPKGRRPFEDE